MLLTPDQAANRLAISVTILNKQVRAGRLRVVAFSGDDPRQWRFTQDEINRFIRVTEQQRCQSENDQKASGKSISGPVESEFAAIFGATGRKQPKPKKDASEKRMTLVK